MLTRQPISQNKTEVLRNARFVSLKKGAGQPRFFIWWVGCAFSQNRIFCEIVPSIPFSFSFCFLIHGITGGDYLQGGFLMGRESGWLLLDNSHKKTSFESRFNARVKLYGDTERIAVFDRQIFGQKPLVTDHPPKQGKAERQRDDSRRRAINKVYDIVFANKWEWWVTLTLDPQKIDRLNVEQITQIAKRWLSNLVQRNGVKYCMVLEYHADKKGIHLHALMSGRIAADMTDSGHKDKTGHKVYNFRRWGLGWSTAIRVYKQGERLAGYLTKYMTKQPDKIAGKWYWSGGKLEREVPTEYFNADYESAPGKEYAPQGAPVRVKYYTVRGGVKDAEGIHD